MFWKRSPNIRIRNYKISPLTLYVFALLFWSFRFVRYGFKFLVINIVSNRIRVIAIVIRKWSHCKHGTGITVHNNAVTALCGIFIQRSFKFFFKIILDCCVYSESKRISVLRIVGSFVIVWNGVGFCVLCGNYSPVYSGEFIIIVGFIPTSPWLSAPVNPITEEASFP